MNIFLEDISDDKLNKKVWGFYFCNSYQDPTLFLDSYQELNRETTKKRNWNITRQYQRLGRTRDFYNNVMKAEEVPLDELIKITIKDKFYNLLQVKLWEDK